MSDVQGFSACDSFVYNPSTWRGLQCRHARQTSHLHEGKDVLSAEEHTETLVEYRASLA